MSLPVLNICRFENRIASGEELLSLYSDRAQTHNSNALSSHPDAGFDLLTPTESELVIPPRSFSNKIPLGIKCSMTEDGSKQCKGFYLYPRSSTGARSSLRLSNSVGIIDSGYRGELIALFDNPSDKEEVIVPGQRLVQICTGDLSPFLIKIVNTLSETDRGVGGLGSTGV